MYNVHPYFSLKNLGKKCALYMAKYGKPIKEIEWIIKNILKPKKKCPDGFTGELYQILKEEILLILKNFFQNIEVNKNAYQLVL